MSHCTHLLHVFMYACSFTFLSTERNAKIIPCTKIPYFAHKSKYFDQLETQSALKIFHFFILLRKVPLPSQKPNQRV